MKRPMGMTAKMLGRKALKAALAAAAFILGSSAAQAATGPCTPRVFEGTPYTLCEATDPSALRLFHTKGDGTLYGQFAAVEGALAREGAHLLFAMNAGMFHLDRSAVGLLIEEGVARTPLVTSDGPGNFGLLPNGVFCVLPEGFAVIESRAFAAAPPACRAASQSGPMLVIGGALHPRFLAASPSRYIRNGVGVSADGKTAFFVISDVPVNFYTFARIFRDELGLPNALYFDGSVSRLYAPALGRHDPGLALGPIVGLVAKGPG